jgi:TRAP-type C4-dicarboxylate transport system permease small subunit
VLLACLGTFAAIAWFGALYTWDEYRFEVMSPGLGVPSWYYTIWMPLLSVVICLRILGRMVRVFQAGR